ncbi:MAG TPA: hypothetical protein VLJ18_11850 [Thermoanaerobaculia bacterium]|nr:hypothetical protein [Thermoanaerobaculia bacterium]
MCPLGSPRRARLAAFAAALCAVAAPALAGVRFTPVPAPPDALVISSAAVSTYSLPHTLNIPYGLFAVPGRGMFELGSTEYAAAPCADAQVAGALAYRTYSVSTSCGLFAVALSVVTPAGASLPAGSQVTAMLGGLVGTSSAGVYSFGSASIGSPSFASVLTPSSDGLPANAPVRSLGFAAGRTYVSLSGGGVYDRSTGDRWEDASNGLPTGATVAAIGGSSSAFAAVDAHGIWRRKGVGNWQRDSNGVNSAAVSGFALSFAAAGTAGVLRHVDGVWVPETSGLPPRADARTIASALNGAFEDLVLGTNGQGLFHAFATPVARTLPAIVDTVGVTGQRFRTEITVGNFGVVRSAVTLSLPAPGVSTNLDLELGTELRAPDAITWLRSQGLDVPAGTAVTSLTAGVSHPDVGVSPEGVYMLARVYSTDSSGGTYGVMLEAPTDIDAAEEEASVYGLRSAAGVERSNLAVVHVPGRGSDPITLSVQAFSADGTPAPNVLTRTLAPGEFYQWNDVLLLAGLPEGSSGYARISRVAGFGAWTGYGVVNDAVTSDGALLPLYRPGGLSATRRLLVPIVLDTFGAAGSHYTTELTLANDSTRPSTASLLYHAAPGSGAPIAASAVALPVGAGRQVTLPDVVAFLRAEGVAIPDSLSAGSQAGTLEIAFQGLDGDDAARTVALARTTTPNPNRGTGGRFGVSYAAIAWGGGARQTALVPALSQDAASRSNLAVVNAGGGSEGPITLTIQLRDADTGVDVGSPLVLSLRPGEWFQWNRVIESAGAATSKAIATVTRISGDDTFFAYGVVNDAKTSDGSYIRMIRLDGD